MDDDSLTCIMIFVLVGIAALLFGIIIGGSNVQSQAVENGNGQYNPKTGDFEWLPAT